MFKIKEDKKRQTKNIIITSDEGTIVGDDRYVIINEMKSYHQPAHFYTYQAKPICETLNAVLETGVNLFTSNDTYVNMIIISALNELREKNS